MKFSFLPVVIAAIGFLSCRGNGAKVSSEAPMDVARDSARFTTVVWIDSTHDFGTVVKGEKVYIKYACKNTGDKPMFLYEVRPGCGCTVADYTKTPIPPGGSGEVNAEFDSNHGTAGSIRKSITVKTNTFNRSPLLLFTGIVSDKDSTKGVH